jgi:hypothetical protein
MTSLKPTLNPMPQPRPTVNPMPEPRPTVNPLPEPAIVSGPTVNPMPDVMGGGYKPRPTINPMPQSRSIAFGSFLPSKISLARDGGTIKLSGLLNRSVSAEVRMDGKINSKTRGTFYVSTRVFNRPTAGVDERPAHVDELKALKKAVKAHLKETGEANKAYENLLAGLTKAIKANNFQSKIKHPTTIGG